MTGFSEKISSFAAKNSDDLFLVIDQVFRILTGFPNLYFVGCVHDPFLTRKTPFFTLFILSRTSDNTTFQNIGGTNARAVPHLKL